MVSIRTNYSNIITQNSMKTSTNKLNQTIERMSSGYKVNHAKDNAANYSILTNMSTKISAYEVAESNTMMGLDMVMTASDTLAQMQDKGERLRALAIQAKNGTYGAQSLSAINAESRALISEIQRLYSSAEYNGVKLFDENPGKPVAKAEYNGFIENPYTYTAEEVAAMKKMDEFTSGASGEFKISSAGDLAQLATLTHVGADTSNATFVLENDIDLAEWINEHGWCGGMIDFRGIFDGNGHVIKNTIAMDSVYTLFYSVYGTIKNLGIDGVNKDFEVTENEDGGTGALASYATNIENCYVKNINYVSGDGDTGGLVGYVENIKNCYVDGANYIIGTEGYYGSGGIVGALAGYAGTVENCFAKNIDVVYGTIFVGGLVGWVYDNMKNCYIEDAYVTNYYSNSSSIGGLVGEASGNIQDCYSRVDVDLRVIPQNYGALIGYFNSDINNIKNCIALEQGIAAVGNMSVNNIQLLKEWPSYRVGLQIGINSSENSRVEFDLSFNFNIQGLLNGIESNSSLSIIDNFIKSVNKKQTELGATQNRLESALDEISTQYENLVSSRSTIRDADMAELSSIYVQQQILQDASATLMATSQNLRAESLLGLIQSINR